MAISYVGGKTLGRTNASAAVSVDLTTGLAGGSGGAPLADDIVVVTVSVGTQARTPAIAVTTPTGYTPLTVQRTSATTYDTNVQTSYKRMGSTPDTTVTVPGSANNADGLAYAIQVFRGVDTTTAEDVAATYATGTGDNKPNPAAITPVTSGAWILACGGGTASNGTTLYTTATLSGFLSANGADTNDGTVGVGYFEWTSGPYDPVAFGGGGSTNTANSWGATTIALRPSGNNNYALTCNHGTYSVTGQSVTVTKSKLITANNGNYSVTGQSAMLARNRVLTAQAGAYSLTGRTATLLKSKLLTAINGSYSVTGRTATLLKSKLLTAINGSYSVTGQTAVITYTPGAVSYTLTAQAGSYALTGQSASVNRNRSLTASAGSYSATGQSATLLRSKLLTATTGSYTLAGQPATLLRSKLLVASVGAYAYTGQSAALARNRNLTASSGSYALTGQSASVNRNRALTASAGSYAYTGRSIVIVKSGLIWPDPADVKSGVLYGPTGADYTGTLVGGTVWLRRR